MKTALFFKFCLTFVLFSFLTLALLSSCKITSDSDDDDSPTLSDDHGNTAGTATVLGPNATLVGTIETSGDVDYFSIAVTSAGFLTVFTSGSTDTHGILYATDGMSELAANDDGGEATNFSITYFLSSTGTYYIAVSESWTTNTGAYSITSAFTATAPDDGDTTGTAALLGPNETLVNHAIEVGGDVDYFAITVTEAGTLTVSTTGSTDIRGYLYASDGTSLLDSNDDIDYPSNTNFSVTTSPAGTGTYYIKVDSYYNSETGLYSITSTFY